MVKLHIVLTDTLSHLVIVTQSQLVMSDATKVFHSIEVVLYYIILYYLVLTIEAN